MVDMQPAQFWNCPFRPVANNPMLTLYYVFDVVPMGPQNGKYCLAEAQVAREVDFGRNDKMFTITTHLGRILKPGNHAWGYNTETCNFSDMDMKAWNNRSMPSVVLVKKAYLNRKKNRRRRHWKLNKLDMEGDVDMMKEERDIDEFMNELEEDPEFRATVNLYPVGPDAEEILAEAKTKPMAEGSDNEDDDDDEDDFPDIEMSELVKDVGNMKM